MGVMTMRPMRYLNERNSVWLCYLTNEYKKNNHSNQPSRAKGADTL